MTRELVEAVLRDVKAQRIKDICYEAQHPLPKGSKAKLIEALAESVGPRSESPLRQILAVMRPPELVAACKHAGLVTDGKRDALVRRLRRANGYEEKVPLDRRLIEEYLDPRRSQAAVSDPFDTAPRSLRRLMAARPKVVRDTGGRRYKSEFAVPEIKKDLLGETLPAIFYLALRRFEGGKPGFAKMPKKAEGWRFGERTGYGCIDGVGAPEPIFWASTTGKRYGKRLVPVAGVATDLPSMLLSGVARYLAAGERAPQQVWRDVAAAEERAAGLEAFLRKAVVRLVTALDALDDRSEPAEEARTRALALRDTEAAEAPPVEDTPAELATGEPGFRLRWKRTPKVDDDNLRVAPHDKYVLLLPSSILPVKGTGVALVHIGEAPFLAAKVLTDDRVDAKAWHPTRGKLQPLVAEPFQDPAPTAERALDGLSQVGGQLPEGVDARIDLGLFGGALGTGARVELRVVDGERVELSVVGAWARAVDADDPNSLPIMRSIRRHRDRAPAREPAPRTDVVRVDRPDRPPPAIADAGPALPAVSIRWPGAPPQDFASYPEGAPPKDAPMLVLPAMGELLPRAIAVHRVRGLDHRVTVLPEGAEVSPLAWHAGEGRLAPIELVPFDDRDLGGLAAPEAKSFEAYASPARLGGHPRWLQDDASTKTYRYAAHLSCTFFQYEDEHPWDLYLLLSRDGSRGRAVVQM